MNHLNPRPAGASETSVGEPRDAHSTPNSIAERTESGAKFKLTVIRDVEGVAQLKDAYRSLRSLTGNPLPFAMYEWHLQWCKHFLSRHGAIVDQPLFHVIHDARGMCVAIIPLIFTRRRVGVFRISTIGFLGADPALTEIRTPQIAPGYEEVAAAMLHASLNKTRGWDWIQWIGAGDAFSAAIARLRSLEWQPLASDYVLDLPSSWEEFRSRLKRNVRESLRHCYNSLKREGHEFSLQVAADADTIPGALDRLLELHSMRAAMSGGSVVHADRFGSTVSRGFVAAVCSELASSGMARIFQLQIAGQTVASRLGFLVEDNLYLYYSGYDPRWSRYSVMTTTVAEALKYAMSQGVKTVNLSPGNDVSKSRWGPREVPYLTAHEHNGRLHSRLLHHLYVTVRSNGVQSRLLRRLVPGRRVWG